MIMWKKYYSRKVKKMNKKKYTGDLNAASLFKQDHIVYYNGQIFVSICGYLKLNLNNYFNNYSFEPKEVPKFLKEIKERELYIKKYKKFVNQMVQKHVNQMVQKHVKSFLNVIFVLENIKNTFYQSFFLLLSKKYFQKRDFLVFYVIYFNFSASNTNLQLVDSSGKSIIFYSAGLVNLKGKQKILRRLVLIRLFNLLSLLKSKFIKNAPVALHLQNVGSNKFLIVKKLKRKFFIKIIKSFELDAYNGCRKRKEKRKRNRKKKK
jgi:hypothetical protein